MKWWTGVCTTGNGSEPAAYRRHFHGTVTNTLQNFTVSKMPGGSRCNPYAARKHEAGYAFPASSWKAAPVPYGPKNSKVEGNACL